MKEKSTAETTSVAALSAGQPRTRRGDVIIPLLTVVFDALAIGASFLFSYWLRFRSPLFDSLGFTHADAPPIEGYLTGSLFILVVWMLIFHSRRMYRPRRNVSLSDELLSIIKVVSIGMLVVMSVAFFYREFSYSRIVFGLLWGTSIASLFAGRAIIQRFERYLYSRGRNLQYAVIIGNDALANEVYERLNNHPAFGIVILGYFAPRPSHEELALSRTQYLGSIDTVAEFVRRNGIERVFIALRAQDHHLLHDVIAEAEGVNVEFMMVPDVLEILTSQVQLKELEGIPFLRIKGIPLTFWGRVSKRTFDVVISFFILLLLSPLWLLIMLLIRLDSRGPIFFKQERVGLDGRKFKMVKFRSMRVGSERFDNEAGLGIKDDPRRTRLGVFLRKTSLDELPQLYNVLKGHMSLVGPRPERSSYVDQFKDSIPKYLDRHRVKTGLTGWAQVNGLRGDTSIEERIKYDLYYIENWSLGFDIKILLRTIKAVFDTTKVH